MVVLFMFIKLLVTQWVIYEASEKVNTETIFQKSAMFPNIFFGVPFYVLGLVAEAQKDIILIFQ